MELENVLGQNEVSMACFCVLFRLAGKLDIVWSGNKLAALVECSSLQRLSSLTIHIHDPIASGERLTNHDLSRLIYLL